MNDNNILRKRNSELSKEHDKITKTLEEFSNFSLQQKDQSPDEIILQKTLNYPPDFIFYYLHLKNVQRNNPHYVGNRYNDDIIIQQNPSIKELNLPFPYVHQYMYGILSFIPQYWYHIIEQFFNLPSYHTSILCRQRIQKRERFSLEILKSSLLSNSDGVYSRNVENANK